MKCAKGPRVLIEWPDDLVMTAQQRICDRCGQPTIWASPRQKTKGRHWACIPGNTFWRCGDEHFERVFMTVLRAFPGATITMVDPAGPMEIGYTGPGEGPCALCGGAIRRYGEGGLPLCRKCDQERINGGA